MDNAAVLRGMSQSAKDEQLRYEHMTASYFVLGNNAAALTAGADALELLTWLLAKSEDGITNMQRAVQACTVLDDVEKIAREMWEREKR